jgi:hypothetical protein
MKVKAGRNEASNAKDLNAMGQQLYRTARKYFQQRGTYSEKAPEEDRV